MDYLQVAFIMKGRKLKMIDREIDINTDKDIIWVTKFEFGEWVLLAQMVGSDFIDNKNKHGYEIWLTNQRHHDLKIKLNKRVQFEDEIDGYVMELMETGRIKMYIDEFVKLSGGKNLKNYKEIIEE